MKKTWVHTNPETLETYRFGEDENGTIHTLAFLGYKCPNGKLVKPTATDISEGKVFSLYGVMVRREQNISSVTDLIRITLEKNGRILHDAECDEIEDTVRSSIFHSSLDWQTKRQLMWAIREADKINQELKKEDENLL